MRDRMDLGELLRQQQVDPGALEQAPATLNRDEQRLRILRMPPWPCSVCGEPSATARPYDSLEHGPRWVDLCWDHALLTRPPALKMPTTLEGIFADMRKVATELGLTMRIMTADEFEGRARRARKRHEES
ncbi:hypothetical protein WKI71_21895 [Streptomyces sp. MS1.AVA.1]|uniref:Uncharacterized protein n=1 Tax=Streptomyces machairae TaxID=3134109 RepID=A0ABU8UNI6_9ACTN